MTETTGETPMESAGFALPEWFSAMLSLFLTVFLPLVLILINARFLMSDAFLRMAYNSSIVPEDSYGFTTDDRLELAPLALGYLFNNEGIEFLGDQTFPDGSPLYNERELTHMVDVKVVTRKLSVYGYSLIGVSLVAVVLLVISVPSRSALYHGLFRGSLFTVALIVTGLIAVATSFNWLFTQFHNLFFEPGTWVFFFSDTLIRLFPIEFWTLAFALMFGGALVEALIIGGVSWTKIR